MLSLRQKPLTVVRRSSSNILLTLFKTLTSQLDRSRESQLLITPSTNKDHVPRTIDSHCIDIVLVLQASANDMALFNLAAASLDTRCSIDQGE